MGAAVPDDADLLASLERAVTAAPADDTLRLHLAQAYARAARHEDAVRHAATLLAHDPTNAAALALVAQRGRADDALVLADLEEQFGGTDTDATAAERPEAAGPAEPDAHGPRGMVDVAGMSAVKARLEQAFFAPLRNPSIASLYGMQPGGGLLLYGPPGCGKTYISRAVAAEIGAQFVAATLADLYSRWLGESEQNVQHLFDDATRRAPCVVFLDELDALGHKRSAMAGNGGRGAVNQLLVALDGAAERGVYTIGATNHPWDVDPALLRPGRLDRLVLVEPPDRTARAEVLRIHLRDRPAERLDLEAVADATRGFSGADLAHVATTAVQAAFAEALSTGHARPVTTPDLLAAAREVVPSTEAWFETARTVIRFGGKNPQYDSLRDYMRREKLL
jgi:hypothetical protein